MSIDVKIEIDENTLKELVIEHLTEMMGGSFNAQYLTIEVKSQQNFKSEWEKASFRARYSHILTPRGARKS